MKLADRIAPSNLAYLQGSSRDLSFIDRPVDVVTFGRSFHWMNRSKLLKDLDKILPADAYLAFFNVGPIDGETRDHRWFKRLVKTAKELADVKQTADMRVSRSDELSQFLLLRYAFSDVTSYSHLYSFEWTIDRATAWILTRYATGTSNTADRLPSIKAAVEKALVPFDGKPLVTKTSSTLLLATRPRKQ